MTALIFDIGNVLIRWRPAAALGHLFSSEEEMAATLEKIDFSGWNMEQDRGRSWEEGIAAGAAAHPEHAEVFAVYAQGLDPAHREPIPETIALLETLSANGVPLYALTNAAVETVAKVREIHSFMALFKDIVISGVEGAIKPDPKIFQTLLARNGLSAGDCIFIDDGMRNVEGARAIGMDAIHFTDARTLQADLNARGVM